MKCHCGCGKRTLLARRTRHDIGHIEGRPLKYIAGHNSIRGLPLSEKTRNKIKESHPLRNLTGKTFKYLCVIKFSHSKKRKTAGSRNFWFCKCVCGKQIIVDHDKLIYNRQISCGCKKKQHLSNINTIHGFSKSKFMNKKASPEYKCWIRMKDRCFNSNYKEYKYYGGRGITVCDEWRNSFIKFYEHIGKRPSEEYSIDRINTNGNYQPGNVRWATAVEQAANRRIRKDSTLISLRGYYMPPTQKA